MTDASNVLEIEHVHDRHPDVGAAVYVYRRVTGSDAQTRLARFVGSRHRLRPAGRPDEVDAGVMEQVLRYLERGIRDHLERVGRQANLLARLLEQLRRVAATTHRARRRTHDQRVPGLGADDRFEQRRRGRVGDRQQREYHADRLGDVLERALTVLVDHADRFLIFQVVVEELGGDVVLEHLVLEHAELGFLHRQLRQLDGVLEARHRHRPDDPIDGLLVEFAQRHRRRMRALDEAVQPGGPLVRRAGRVFFDCCRHCVLSLSSRAPGSSGRRPMGRRSLPRASGSGRPARSARPCSGRRRRC